jgi:Protein tyrosine and serine/threonine kinase
MNPFPGESEVSGNQTGVTGERWKEVETLFEQALKLGSSERAEFLKAIQDDELRRQVESLLQTHSDSGAFLGQLDHFFSSESLEAESLSPGQVIDRYRIIREIGRGGMGAVFLAERADDQYQKQVAIKLIKRGTDTDAVLRHFFKERQILAGFDHPNIALLRAPRTAGQQDKEKRPQKRRATEKSRKGELLATLFTSRKETISLCWNPWWHCRYRC